MGYASNEFEAPVSVMQASQGAACVIGTSSSTTAWYVCNGYGPGGQIMVNSVALDSVEQGACTATTSWATTPLEVDGWRHSALATDAGMGLCVPSNPILVWNNGNEMLGQRHGIWAAEYGGGSQPDRWAVPTQLLTKEQGNPPIGPAADSTSVAATAWGTDSIIVACPMTSSGEVFVGTYVLGERNTSTGTWVAAYQRRISVADIAAALPGVTDTGTTVSCDWFPSGKTDANGPVGYLAIGLNPRQGGPIVGYVQLVVDADNVPQVDATQGVVVWDRLPGPGPSVVARDPAGRVRAYTLAAGELTTQTFATTQAPAPGGAGGHALPLLRTDTRPAPHGRSLPAVAFAVLPAATTVSTLATVVGASGVASIAPVTAMQTRAFEVLFYQDQPTQDPPDLLLQADTFAQVGTFGWAEAITTTGSPSRSATAVQPGAVIRGILDGPVPIPLGNVPGALEMAELNYSATRTGTVDHQATTSWTAGMKSTGQPDSGLGPVWDISVASGTGSVTDDSAGSGTTTGTSQPTSTFVGSSGATEMDQAGWVSTGQSPVSYTANRWIESVGSTTDDRPAALHCADGTYRLYARHAGRLEFYLGVPVGGAVTQWGMDDITWEYDHEVTVAVAGAPSTAGDPATDGGSGHVWTQDSFGSAVRFTQTAQGWTDLFDPTSVGIGAYGGDPVAFLVGDVEHVLVVDTGGQLWDIHPGGPNGWSADNLSATQKPPMLARRSPSTHPAVSVDDNGDGSWTVTVLFPSQQGHLFMLYNPAYPSTTTWTYDDLSYEVKAQVGGWATIDADVSRCGDAIMSTGTMGTGSPGHLQQWSWAPPHGSTPAGWTCTDVSTLVGNTAGEPWPQMLGTCAVLPPDPDSPDRVNVLARRTDGHLLLVSQSGDGPWTHQDLTAYATNGVAVAGDPVAVDWDSAVVVATDGHLTWVGRDPTSAGTDPTAPGTWSMTDITVAAGAGPHGPAVIADATSGSGQTPQWVGFTSTFQGDGSFSKYPLYGPVAGDLLSYTAHSWNTRMAALGLAWNQSRAAGQDPLYEGSDYVNDVVHRYARTFSDGSRALTATWTGGPTGAEAFQTLETDFVESSWTLDASFYAGIGWGGLPEGADAAGIFGNEAWSVMVGGSIHIQRTSTATDQTAWGISVSGPASATRWGPPPIEGAAGPGVVADYSFEVYYLPPPTAGLPSSYWTTELRAGLASLPADQAWGGVGYVHPEAIDPGSGAWKVMFVLTSYTAGPTLTLEPPSPTAGQPVQLSGTMYGLNCETADLVLATASQPSTVVHDYGTVLPIDPNGRFGEGAELPAVTVTLPADLAPGSYLLQATTATGPATGTAAFTIT